MPNKTRDYGDIRITMTYNYGWTWDTTNMGARRGITGYHPTPDGDLRPLGTYAEPGSYHEINQQRATILVGHNPNSTNPRRAVASPTDYVQIWRDTGSPGKHDGSFWRPIAPSGYKSLGDVLVYKYNKPNVNLIWCVREDLVTSAQFPASSIWDDKSSGCANDCAIWSILPNDLRIDGNANIPLAADTFRAFGHYNRPDQELANILVLPIGRDYKELDTETPKITKSTILRRASSMTTRNSAR